MKKAKLDVEIEKETADKVRVYIPDIGFHGTSLWIERSKLSDIRDDLTDYHGPARVTLSSGEKRKVWIEDKDGPVWQDSMGCGWSDIEPIPNVWQQRWDKLRKEAKRSRWTALDIQMGNIEQEIPEASE